LKAELLIDPEGGWVLGWRHLEYLEIAMNLSELASIHPVALSVLDLVLGLAVYAGLRSAFVRGRYKDFGEASYGRDERDEETGEGGCLIALAEFCLIMSFWVLYLIFNFKHIVYGWKIIIRRRHPGQPV